MRQHACIGKAIRRLALRSLKYIYSVGCSVSGCACGACGALQHSSRVSRASHSLNHAGAQSLPLSATPMIATRKSIWQSIWRRSHTCIRMYVSQLLTPEGTRMQVTTASRRSDTHRHAPPYHSTARSGGGVAADPNGRRAHGRVRVPPPGHHKDFPGPLARKHRPRPPRLQRRSRPARGPRHLRSPPAVSHIGATVSDAAAGRNRTPEARRAGLGAVRRA